MCQAEQEKEGFSSEKKTVDALCHLVKQQSATDIELDVLDGNPLDFHYFMTLFHEVVKRELMIQEKDWQDCSNTQVGMQKRFVYLGRVGRGGPSLPFMKFEIGKILDQNI